MSYINESKSFKRTLLKRLIDKGENNKTIADILEFSESWVKQLPAGAHSTHKHPTKPKQTNGAGVVL